MHKLQEELRELGDTSRAEGARRFFKTEPGQYGHGDVFLGITVPTTRAVARKYVGSMTLKEIADVLRSPNHEERLAALMILCMQLQKGQVSVADGFRVYWDGRAFVNNWDLVDCSAEIVVGPYVASLSHEERVAFVDACIADSLLWVRRIIMVSTFYQLKQRNHRLTVYIAERLLGDKEDLMHKAVGWLLREMGKRVGREHLIAFLDAHAAEMPRTALRYAMEHLLKEEYQRYLKLPRR